MLSLLKEGGCRRGYLGESSEGSVVLAGFRSKCHIIPHGIDLERFKTTPELKEPSKRG